MIRGTAQQSGFTLIELAIASLVISLILGAMSTLLASTTELSKTGHINTRAVAEHRRNLESLSSVLRTVDIRSLGGFDGEGRARTPTFSRVTGVDMVDVTVADPEHIVWRSKPTPVEGVWNAGALWLVSDSEERIVADRVPAGQFEVRQEGAVLAIRLTTYYAVDNRHVTSITSETAVKLRN